MGARKFASRGGRGAATPGAARSQAGHGGRSTENLVDALESVRDFDMGLGARISFGPTEHQGSHKVWGSQLNENGRYQAIDLE
jgi:hypothetical protein